MNLTGPLSKNYCSVFMWLSLISLFFSLISIIYVIYALAVGKKQGIVSIILSIPYYLVTFIINRLLYNMCIQ
jgi:hypothetical protein